MGRLAAFPDGLASGTGQFSLMSQNMGAASSFAKATEDKSPFAKATGTGLGEIKNKKTILEMA
jgi:hypothetical protein